MPPLKIAHGLILELPTNQLCGFSPLANYIDRVTTAFGEVCANVCGKRGVAWPSKVLKLFWMVYFQLRVV
jgi:hypothetical protein